MIGTRRIEALIGSAPAYAKSRKPDRCLPWVAKIAEDYKLVIREVARHSAMIEDPNVKVKQQDATSMAIAAAMTTLIDEAFVAERAAMCSSRGKGAAAWLQCPAALTTTSTITSLESLSRPAWTWIFLDAQAYANTAMLMALRVAGRSARRAFTPAPVLAAVGMCEDTTPLAVSSLPGPTTSIMLT